MDDKYFSKETAQKWIEIIESSAPTPRDLDIYPKLNTWINGLSAAEVLDVGCGQGVCSEKLSPPYKYTGLDASKWLVDRAKLLYRQTNRDFVEGSVYNMPFTADRFDAAFSVSLWHLLSDLEKAASELHRVLKQGAPLLIMSANPECYEIWTEQFIDVKVDGLRFEGTMLKDGLPGSRDVLYLHTLNEILGSLRRAGFEILEVETFRSVPKESTRKMYVSIRGRKT